MIDAWVLWILLVGLVAGGTVTWLVMVRLPRREDDVSVAERPAEAAWISGIIERHGGVAPASLVEEVLDLHQAYLADARNARLPASGAARDVPNLPPVFPGGPTGMVASRPRGPGYPAPGSDPGGPLSQPPIGPPGYR